MDQECSICFYDNTISKMECQCMVCKDCLLEYFKISIRGLWYGEIKSFNVKCPGKCRQLIYLDKLLQIAAQNQFENIIQEELFKKYCQKAQDVFKCPNNYCEFYYLQSCKMKCEEICLLCQQNITNSKLSLKQSLNDGLSLFQQFMTTYECPQCQVPILKNGGCSHMTCQICKYEFCWDCKQDCNKHDWSVCIYHNLFFILIKTYLGYNLIYLFQADIYLITAFLFLFNLTKRFLINNLILALMWLLTTQLQKEEKNQMIKHRIYFSTFSLVIFITLAYYEDITIWSWFSYLIFESIVALAGIVVLTITHNFYMLLKKKQD
ncbi:hypothetical protein pb186bvf_013208 [Paramecium bursaria]